MFGFGDSQVIWGGLGKTLATRPESAAAYAGVSHGAIYSITVPFVGQVIPVLYDPAPAGNNGASKLSLINLGSVGLSSWGLIISGVAL